MFNSLARKEKKKDAFRERLCWQEGKGTRAVWGGGEKQFGLLFGLGGLKIEKQKKGKRGNKLS